MKAIHITAYTEDASKVEALKAFMKALKIEFELTEGQSPYNPEFVEKVLESRQQAKNGKVKRVKKEDLEAYLTLWYGISQLRPTDLELIQRLSFVLFNFFEMARRQAGHFFKLVAQIGHAGIIQPMGDLTQR